MDNLPMTYEELTEEIRKVKRAEMIGPNEGGITYEEGLKRRQALTHKFAMRAVDVLTGKNNTP